ncbi:MAG: hypothetical protein K2G06_09295 [Muribaculaceae bacterium]|nr:hypothetical protein [Muribaculaceae bacterium]
MITTIVGYAACVCMIFGYLPQAIYTIRTNDTDSIAVPTFLLMGLGSVFFVIQGILLGNWPLLITNVVTGLCSAIIFTMKLRNDWRRRRSGKPRQTPRR